MTTISLASSFVQTEWLTGGFQLTFRHPLSG
jgi:hypothetical protein